MTCRHLGQGWQRAALFNVIGVSVFTILTVALLAWSSSQSGGLNTNLIFFEGTCDEAKSTNLWLHLLINIISTGILTSSNFFMQVLNSPTRSEVVEAHRQNKALSIGITSIGNLSHVARRKSLAWLLFFLSSIPIHLFANSTIFSTEYQGADWHLVMASEGFVHGAQYFGPGAMLWKAGAPLIKDVTLGGVKAGYGWVTAESDYFDPESNTSKYIALSAQNSGKWKRLEVPDCLSQYLYCNARTKFRDVVWVVESQNSTSNYMMAGNNSLGWSRSNMMLHMSEPEETKWSKHVPANASNSLWFAANCTTKTFFNMALHQTEGCHQGCNGAMGWDQALSVSKSPGIISHEYTFDFLPGFEDYSLSELRGMYTDLSWPGLKHPSTSKLDLQYCLAEEIYPSCKLGLSNIILFVIVLCLMVKTMSCIWVIAMLPGEQPLVVLGDAIETFIRFPDPSTAGWCTVNRKLAEKSGTMRSHTGPPHACRWHKEGGSWASAMSRRVWRWSYLLFASDIAFLAAVFGIAQQTNPIDSTKPTISQSLTNGILDPTGGRADSLVPAVLTANLPQLLLSLSYFMYNSLYTQLCIEKEWSSFSTRYRTLRVTRPQGQQRSTYRLQLPYRYSIPLILVSIILHWLVSNALYVFILEGGYFWTGTGSSSEALLNQKLPSFRGSGISGDAYVGIGYSTTALLALLFAAILLPIIPVALAMRKTTGTIPPGGSNSMVVCAACHIHVPDLVAPQQEDSGSENFFEESKSAEAYRLEVSRSPIRWGVIKLHTTLNDGGIYSKVAPGHLSFGTRDSEITEPVTGSWYK